MNINVSPSPFYRSATWAILTAISFAVMITAVHYMDGKFDAFQIVFPRKSEAAPSCRGYGRTESANPPPFQQNNCHQQ